MMRHVDVGDASIHVAELGEGPPLVLLHGLFVGSLAQWYFIGAGALAAQRRLICIDLRGHGRSSRPADGYDLPTLARDVDRVLDHLDVTTCDVAGHSYGGLVGLHLAARRPVDQLVLLDAPLPGPPSNPALASPEALLAALPGPLQAALQGGGRRARRLLEGVRALAQDTTLLTDIERETVDDLQRRPVHLIYGDRSGCLDAETWFRAHLDVQSSQRIDAGHFLLAEAPDAVVAALRRCL